ncbi:branched-chain amino acid aminotransferase 2, chloroplastic-like isoform X3 [Lolium rigidum]|uniref:branched-chain amino acid aminotransferase 2, chloroplastic-like isoform X3 n=1 Tax=Lolium rigidum TaxID=89674 RepID=UPI001F5DD7D6|nr:branched-chain amino acid aminotransferase 2, chloroplastic-like isoform X3 [Lolium rigidum]
MYMAKCGPDGNFSKGEMLPFGPIALSPSAGVLNYGQGLFEGLKAYRKTDGSILLFRPDENARRMVIGADRMCMPAPTVEQFMDAVKQTVLANKRWVPPTGKGSLYIRPLLIGSGAILGVAPAPEFTFVIYVSPVGNYFKGLAPIKLIIEDNFHRAAPGGTGGVKTIGNYASVLKAQTTAKEKGYSDVLYLDAVHNKYLEEASASNIFVVKGNTISTPAIEGTILPGITRKSIIEVAESKGYKVEERRVSVDELLVADEVFCTGTAVVVSPVGSITYQGKRVEYDGNHGVGVVSQQLYTSLTGIQMGLLEDRMGWTVQLN